MNCSDGTAEMTLPWITFAGFEMRPCPSSAGSDFEILKYVSELTPRAYHVPATRSSSLQTGKKAGSVGAQLATELAGPFEKREFRQKNSLQEDA